MYLVKVIINLNCSQHYWHLHVDRLRRLNLIWNPHEFVEDTPLMQRSTVFWNHWQPGNDDWNHQDHASQHRIKIWKPRNKELEPSPQGIRSNLLHSRLRGTRNRMLVQTVYSSGATAFCVTMFCLKMVLPPTHYVCNRYLALPRLYDGSRRALQLWEPGTQLGHTTLPSVSYWKFVINNLEFLAPKPWTMYKTTEETSNE